MIKPTVVALSAGVLLASSAQAGPIFQSKLPGIAMLADAYWDAGVQCSGHEPASWPVVPIDTVEHEWASGMAYIGEARGLRGIRLRESTFDEPTTSSLIAMYDRTLPHEIGHAWSHGENATLTEGQTELLAWCMHLVLGVPHGPPPRIGATPDPRTWAPHEDGPGGYGQAFGMAQVHAELLGTTVLWAPDQPTTLESLAEHLAAAGPAGNTWATALLDPARRRALLSDPDNDGVPNLVETLRGTDPETSDTQVNPWLPGEGSGLSGPLKLVGGTPEERLALREAMDTLDRALPPWARRPLRLLLDAPVSSGGTIVSLGPEFGDASALERAAFARALDLAWIARRDHRRLDVAEVLAQFMLGQTLEPRLILFGDELAEEHGRLVHDGLLDVPGLPDLAAPWEDVDGPQCDQLAAC